MRKIKIIHIIHSLTLGDGITEVVRNIAKKIDRNKFSFTIFCLVERGNLADHFESIGIKVFNTSAKSTTSLTSIPKNFYSIWHLVKLLKKEKFDILQAHEFFSGTLGRIAGWIAKVPLIILGLHGRCVWKRTHHIIIDRLLSKITDKFVSNSEAIMKYTIEMENIPKEKFIVIHNGIDLSRFNNIRGKKQIKNELGIKESDFVVGTIGRLSREKGFKYLIEAADILCKKKSNIKFLIVGGDAHPTESVKTDLYKQVENLVLMNTVIFTGIRKDIPQILDVFDIFVLPSQWEGFGLVIVEAMAMKKPVIASGVDGIVEIVKDGLTGFLIPPKDAKILAEKILYLIENRESALSMGIEGRKRVENNFTAEVMVRKYESLYHSLYMTKFSGTNNGYSKI